MLVWTGWIYARTLAEVSTDEWFNTVAVANITKSREICELYSSAEWLICKFSDLSNLGSGERLKPQ